MSKFHVNRVNKYGVNTDVVFSGFFNLGGEPFIKISVSKDERSGTWGKPTILKWHINPRLNASDLIYMQKLLELAIQIHDRLLTLEGTSDDVSSDIWIENISQLKIFTTKAK